jgi:tRNA A-37 threonylcarbamoyl transferase component Bud32
MKNKYKNKNKNKNKVSTKKISTYDGGAAFTKGGFGCVFKPALGCKNSDTPPRANYVSKLIENSNGKREYMYIYHIKKKLEHLPVSIKRYFLLDNINMCEPKPLSEQDKVKIENVCDDILTKVSDTNTNISITSETINRNLHKFKIINMPELSLTLRDYIKKTVLSSTELIMINNIIIQYLTVVIPSMYKNNVVHGDIKGENMMFNKYDNNTLVLIDWGLSYIADSDRKNVPSALYNLSVQWMHPFSSFLFKKNVIEKYYTFLKNLKKGGIVLTRDSLRVFAITEYTNFMIMHEKQFSFFNDIFNIAYSDEFAKYLNNEGQSYNETLMIYNMTLYYIVEYTIDVLLAYTVDYKLNLGKYFNEVYIMNIDAWGVMSIYNNLIEQSQAMFKMNSTEHKIFINKVMYILTDNIFKNGNLPINIPKLVSDIKNLNKYLMSIGSKRTSATMVNQLGVARVARVSNTRRSNMGAVPIVANGGYKTRKRGKCGKRLR